MKGAGARTGSQNPRATASYDFVEQANPHAWLLTADRLHGQAVRLRGAAADELLIQLDGQGREISRLDHANKACFLLAGFAMENALKAFLVYENPGWISNGTLARDLRTHSLTRLQRRARLVPYKSKSLWVPAELESGLESWARYPCALNAEGTKAAHEEQMTARLWGGYLRLMRAYGRRLSGLLAQEWQGPHGWHGRWTGSHDFFLSPATE